jgi:hypothetical protein
MYEGLSDRELMVGVYFSLGQYQRFVAAAPDNFDELTFAQKINHISWKGKKIGDLSRDELAQILERIEDLKQPIRQTVA